MPQHYPKTTKPLNYKQLKRKFGNKHANQFQKEITETTITEHNTPSGGWCINCQRYDCGHFTENGEVLLGKPHR